jgi:hypothetical protein
MVQLIIKSVSLFFFFVLSGVFAAAETMETNEFKFDGQAVTVEKQKDFYGYLLNGEKIRAEKYIWKAFLQGQEIGTIQCTDNPLPGPCSKFYATWHNGDLSDAKTLVSLDEAVQYLTRKETAFLSVLTDMEWTTLAEPRLGIKVNLPGGKGVEADFQKSGEPLAAYAEMDMEKMFGQPASQANWNKYAAIVRPEGSAAVLVISLFVHEKQPVPYERAMAELKGLAGIMLPPSEIESLQTDGEKIVINGVEGYDLKFDHRIMSGRMLVFYRGGRQILLQFQISGDREAVFRETMARVVGSLVIS